MDTEYYRALLIEKLEQLSALSDIGNEAAKPVELDQTRVGRLSRMDALQAQAMSVEAKRRREQEVMQIKSALERIDEANYGDCLACYEPIAEARLKLNPAVLFCIKCAETKT